MFHFFVERPKLAMVVSIILVILGVVSLLNLPITQFPSITPPSVNVRGTYTGADAVTVEEAVTVPLETEINGTPGMKYISSSSTNNGASSIEVTFELGTDIDIAALDVQNRVGIAEPRLPEAVRRLGVVVRKRNPGLFMLLALQSPNGTHDAAFLDNYMNIYVRDEILRVDGIGDANAITKDFSMRLWLNPKQMALYGLGPADVTAALNEQNVLVAAGAVGAPPQFDAQAFEYTVFVDGRLEDPAAFADIIVANDPATGGLVRLKDVGRVELGTFNYGNQSQTNGKPTAILILYQAPGSNALETAKNVYATMDELAERFPSDLEYLVPFESVSIVEVSIREVINTLLIALAIVAFVVFVFLQRWRATLIPVIAIPVSILGAFMVFTPLGFTVNTLTLFGFVLAIGIVVDDSIVMVEAIEKNMEEGEEDMDDNGAPTEENDAEQEQGTKSPVAAAHQALDQVATPVITTSLILVAIFLPSAFIPGLTGQLYQQFAITISVSVLLSSLVALTLAPALAVSLLKAHQQNETTWLTKIFGPFNRGLENLTKGYRRAIGWCINHAWAILALFAGIGIACYFLFRTVSTGFIPPEDGGRIFVTFELPEAASNSRTLGVLDVIMNTLDTIPEVANYSGVAGLNAITFTNRSNTGTVFVQLAPWSERKDRDQSVFALVGRLNKSLNQKIVDARVVVIPPPPIPGLGSTSGFSFILQDRNGSASVQDFETQLEAFVGRINQRPEITGAFSFFTAETPSYELLINREKAKQLGVPLASIYRTVQMYLGSSYVNDFTLYGRTFRVVAQADTAFRTSIEDLADYYVANRSGEMVRLSTLIDYELTSSAPLISHYNLFRSASISGNAAAGYSSGQALQALREEAAKLPFGYGFEFSGLSREQASSGNTTLLIFGFSILIAFLILVGLYESWTVPFAVLAAAPVGIFGSMLVLWLFGPLNNNVYAQIGLITVIGLAAKNAILIVEYAKKRVESGQDIIEATRAAAGNRLRPILMTSATFIFGMIPLALASGASANSRRTIGWVVIGGLFAVTALAIFFVPVIYAKITALVYSEEELEKEPDE